MIPGKHQPNNPHIQTADKLCLFRQFLQPVHISLIIKYKHHKHKAALFSLSPENSPNKYKRTLTNK